MADRSLFTVSVSATEMRGEGDEESHEILFSYIAPVGSVPQGYHIDTSLHVTREGWLCLARTLQDMADLASHQARDA